VGAFGLLEFWNDGCAVSLFVISASFCFVLSERKNSAQEFCAEGSGA
jgi:hypothetical protein